MYVDAVINAINSILRICVLEYVYIDRFIFS